MLLRAFAVFLLLVLGAMPLRAAESHVFEAIEGGPLPLAAYRGGPVLVVNTASHCGYTYQYEGLQTLWQTYRDRGLTVLAVPSNDFRQEKGSNEAVKEFCEVNYGITLPMTEITHVTGAKAHGFYRWLADEHGFAPEWNFYKALLDADGEFVAGFTSRDKPQSRAIIGRIEAMLAGE